MRAMLRTCLRAGATRRCMLPPAQASAICLHVVPEGTCAVAAAIAAAQHERLADVPAAASPLPALEPIVRREFAPPQVELDLREAVLAAPSAHAHAAAFDLPKPLCPLVSLCQIDWPCHVCTPMRGTFQQPTHASLTQWSRMVRVDGYLVPMRGTTSPPRWPQPQTGTTARCTPPKPR